MNPLPKPQIEDLLVHATWVRDLARRLAANTGEADDLEQETWIAALRRPPTNRKNLRGWLARVLQNLASRSRRTEARRSRLEEGAARPEAEPSVAQLHERAQVQHELVEAVLDLEKPYGSTVLLRYFEGVPPRIIAQRQGVPVNTVRTRLARGLTMLRSRLDRTHGDGRGRASVLLPLALEPHWKTHLGLGALLMNTQGKIACALIVVAVTGTAFWWSMGGAPITPPSDSVTVGESSVIEQPPNELESSSPELIPVIQDSLASTSSRTEVAVDGGDVKCIVVGRVVDEDGEPLADVSVRLQAYQVWAQGVETPRLKGRYNMRGFEVTTDAAGAFRIEAPPPTAVTTSLAITPDRFHESYDVSFNSGRSRAQPALTAGVRDLGEIRLSTTGAVRGRVMTDGGRPLANVEMSVGTSRSSSYGRHASTDVDGTYLIGHAPVGTYAVKAKLEGYLSGYLEPVTVDASREKAGIDFILVTAPTIEGIVVNEHGHPVEGANLWGWPSTSGAGAGAKSGVDGRFVVYLPQDEAYTLGAKCDGYRSWGDEHGKSVTFIPGTQDIQIVMESIPQTRFAVVDAETGVLIKRFGLSILENNGSQSSGRVFTERWRPTQREHPGGIAEATARPGIDLFVVAAEGYLLATGDVAYDAPDEPLQTVSVWRGATVRGRALRDGQIVVGASVEIVQGTMRPGKVFMYRDNTRRLTVTDGQGRFELTALAGGTHRLTVKPDDGGPLVLAPLKIADREIRDLGDLILLPGATIVGEVLLPRGVEPAGLHVFLDDRREGVMAVIDGQGEFRFENLAPGSHALTLDDRPGVLAGSDVLGVDLVSGETLAVTLDARDRSMCEVTLTIDLGGLPLAGRQVDLVSTDERREREVLGNCDGSGLVTGSVRAWGDAIVIVHLPGTGSVEHPDVRLHLQPGERVEQTVRFGFARLALRLPRGVAFPRDGTARVRLESSTQAQATQTVYLSFAGGSASGAATEIARATSGELVFGGLVPGRFELTLELTDDTTEFQRVSLGGGAYSLEKPSYYLAKREVILVAGEEFALRLE